MVAIVETIYDNDTVTDRVGGDQFRYVVATEETICAAKI